ncbi:hypothetical protein ABIA39_006290 [Nocardia sp. GAS34]|jgi:hypothetical protein|uniref:hypothetical protein n=1 Tax=unclassified Nocardia TaxID=2637762 RepID=UPI003D1F24BC
MRLTVHRSWRRIAYAVLALPVSLCPIGIRERAARWARETSFESRTPGRGYVAAHTVLGAALGLLTCFLVFLAGLALVRGLAYPLVGDNGLENSWGGPTLMGAWAVHAAFAVLLQPVAAVLLADVGVLQLRLADRLLARGGAWWPVPAAVALAAAGVVLFVAWWHQI